jgi:eukaryotic-like serine/threonine-protein kinase
MACSLVENYDAKWPMNPTDYQKVKALFTEVCELAEPNRSARLAELCDQPELIAQVQALIQQTGLDERRFAQPLIGALTAISAEEMAVGDRLGVWTLTDELGHGGMGTVFKAQRGDGQFEQIAAIKVLRGLPSASALERLAQERQIVANLAHPNIARLLDGGATPQGRPYLVLEYIEGLAIDQYCQRKRLSTLQVIKLMLEICAGLSYAHQRLVVHCDLKPSNILVNTEGRPLLLDFGIAHRLQDQSPEQNSDSGSDQALNSPQPRAYTPGYASPEQRSGAALSTATDIYGLGRVLQVLLNLDADSQSTRLHTLTATASNMPDGIDLQKTPAPLQAIIEHATAANPAQRYVSVSAFADDLQRYLRHEPVSVWRANRLYRFRCYVRRNGLALGLGTTAALALVGGLIGTNLSLHDARSERAKAELAATRATRTAEFLGNILSAADPDRARDLDTTLLREILDQAAVQAKTELLNEPLVLSAVEQVIGNTYYQLGEYDKSTLHLRAALALQPATATHLRERLIIREKIADNYGYEQSQQALSEYQTIYQERLSAFGAEDPDTLRASHAIAFQMVRTGDFRSAEARSKTLQPTLERVLGPNHQSTLHNLQTLAVAQTELAQITQGEQTLKMLVARRIKLHGAAHSETLAVQNSLAIFYLRQSRFAEAEALLRELYPLAKKRLGSKNFKSINFAGLLASALRQNGKLAESGIYYREALDSATKLYGPSHAITLRFGSNYANFELASGNAQSALDRYAKLEPLLNASIGAEHPDMSDMHRTRAKAQVHLKQIAAAKISWQRALAIDRKAYGDDTHPLIVEDLTGLKALDKL